MRVVVTGGLTGGHVLPCISVALALKARGHEVLYIGARGQLEADLCGRYGIRFVGIGFRRHGRVRRRASLAVGLVTAARTIRRYRPAIIFSKGSVVAIPVVLAGRLFRIPTVTHESDVVPGSETRLLARHCAAICVAHQETRALFRRPTHVTGNMTRPYFDGGRRDECVRRYGLPPHKPVVFVTGGSQGSAAINGLVHSVLDNLTRRYSVIHQCGVGKLQRRDGIRDYVQVEFLFDEIKHVYAAADVVVSRAGAGSIAEACHYGAPMILVPHPAAESDHQRLNAMIIESHGLCTVLQQERASPTALERAIDDVIADRADFAERHRAWAASQRHEEPIGRIVGLLEHYARGW